MSRFPRMTIATLGVAAALPLIVYLWGFLVDDAFISARYAANIAAGHGYRFNAAGPSTDGVTPLGFAHLLAPYALDGALGAFFAAKYLGASAWCFAAAMLALAIHDLEGSPAKWIGLALLATSVPLAAWSVAGMETGIVLGLAGIAAAARGLGRERTCCAAAAVVAAWRPEAIPWAIALALAPARRGGGSRWAKLSAVVAPALLVATVRYVVFGRAMPLAAVAKAPNLKLGAMYALACAILCGLIAVVAFKNVAPWVRGLQVAVVVHWLAMAIAGGDWMPVSRLATTALPSLALAAAALAARPTTTVSKGWLGLRTAMAFAGQLFVLVQQGPSLADTARQRFAVMDALREELGRARVVAALDIGWVGVTTSATVVDLAGVTDPEVAVLPGGHTSKRIPRWFVDARHVDTIVLGLRAGETVQEPFYMSRFRTVVDVWVATTESVVDDFAVVAVHRQSPAYVLLRRQP